MSIAGSGGDAAGRPVTNTFYATDTIAAQEIPGVARRTWTLDPAHRLSSMQALTWADGAWQSATTTVNHYAADSDEPAWVHEDTTDPTAITRYVSGADGDLAIATSPTGDRVLHLVDLHGDVMATLPILTSAGKAQLTCSVAQQLFRSRS